MQSSREGREPLVSVVLPTYNRPKMLQDAVESVIQQRYSPIELVVVDDHSDRPAVDVLESIEFGDTEWKCIRHETNRGANVARNTGIEAADGPCIAFIDDDDRWRERKLERQITALEESHPDVGVVLVGQEYVNDEGERTAIRRPSIVGKATEALMRGESAGPFSTILVRAQVIADAGLPDERFPSWQDREWLLRLSQCCHFESVPEPLVVRRIGTHDQIGDDFESKSRVSYPLFLEKHRSLAAEYGVEDVFRARLASTVAGTALATGNYRAARRYALTAIGSDPGARSAYLYLLLALGGDLTYRPAVRLKRTITQLTY